jgi:hypothetical protein
MNATAAELIRQMAEGRVSRDQLNGMVGQLVAHDPVLSQIVQFMQQRAPEVIDAEPLHDASERQRERGRARLQALLADLEALSARAARVADALGACICLGEEACCPHCRGRGVPGTFPVDGELFARLVQPAVQKVFSPGTRSDAEERKDKQ